MARLMVSLGTLEARALSTAVRKRGLPAGSPPDLAATVISFSSLVQPFDLLASEAALVCLIFDQRLCPDIPIPLDDRWISNESLSRGSLPRKGRSTILGARA